MLFSVTVFFSHIKDIQDGNVASLTCLHNLLTYVNEYAENNCFYVTLVFAFVAVNVQHTESSSGASDGSCII